MRLWHDWEFAHGESGFLLPQTVLRALGEGQPGLYLTNTLRVHYTQLVKQLESPTLSKTYNYYRDSHPTEVMKSYIPLGKLMVRVHELLQEWPDHGVLQEIMCLTYKVMQF